MSMSPSKQAAIQAYRSLLRTQKQVFGADIRAIDAARKETYNRFIQFKDETNTDILEEKLQLASQVETLLRRNVVQSVAEGNTDVFKLRITKDTELGDNDSIKKSKNINRNKRSKQQSVGCCGGNH
ncbi:MAG: hypothetical protein EXX96DRAFT_577910 [Benjaminiella poitrasii]|nr:MAG: hypothetical protein EXX96DRAFT_577910 [Benjaminiella poitrasii]